MSKFTGFIVKEDDQYASLCIELDVASCGETEQEAIDGLRDAVSTYLDYMQEEQPYQDPHRPVPMDSLLEFLFPEGDGANCKSSQFYH